MKIKVKDLKRIIKEEITESEKKLCSSCKLELGECNCAGGMHESDELEEDGS